MMNDFRFVAEVEISLTDVELDRLARLSKFLKQDIDTTVRLCLNERCEELLNMYQEHSSIEQ